MSNNNINKIEFDPDSNVAVGDDPLLTGVDVFFRTNNDFKHESTELVNEIQEKNGANWVNKAFADGLYWQFNDESDNGPFSLFVYSPRPKKSEIPGMRYQISIYPHSSRAHDTWKFNYNLYLTFEDGSRIQYNENNLALDQSKNVHQRVL